MQPDIAALQWRHERVTGGVGVQRHTCSRCAAAIETCDASCAHTSGGLGLRNVLPHRHHGCVCLLPCSVANGDRASKSTCFLERHQTWKGSHASALMRARFIYEHSLREKENRSCQGRCAVRTTHAIVQNSVAWEMSEVVNGGRARSSEFDLLAHDIVHGMLQLALGGSFIISKVIFFWDDRWQISVAFGQMRLRFC